MVLGVNSMTASMLVDLWEELRARQAAHTLIAVNCSWESASEIGQPWQRCGHPPLLQPQPPLRLKLL